MTTPSPRLATTIMKTEPFSPHDRSTIIAKLQESGQWEGIRGGCPVRFVRYHAAAGETIQYAVQVSPTPAPISLHVPAGTWVSDQAATVAEAIEECNKLIKGRPARSRGNRRWSPNAGYWQKFGGQS